MIKKLRDVSRVFSVSFASVRKKFCIHQIRILEDQLLMSKLIYERNKH